MTRVSTLADPEAACAVAAQEIAGAIADALSARGAAHVALSGGNTPRRAYELLAPLVPDWEAVELWYADERSVPADDPESTHRLIVESLLAAIPSTDGAAAGGVGGGPIEHRVLGELPAEEAAALYAGELSGRIAAREDGLPVLDVTLLGLGEDGHTASLFPGFPQVQAHGEICEPVHDAPKPPPNRVTLSLDMLNASRSLLLLATGAGKADALARVLAGPDSAVPASLLRRDRLHVVCDAAAAPGS